MSIAALQRFFRVFLYLMGLMGLAVTFTWSVATILSLIETIQYTLKLIKF